MLRKLQQYRMSLLFCFLIFTFIISGCSISGTVSDHARFETSLKHMKLKNQDGLKCLYGGAIRVIPLNNLSKIEIYPSTITVYNKELYYKADIILKNGDVIKNSTDSKNETDKCSFVSIQNMITGKDGNELFSIGLEHVSRLTVKSN